MTSRVRYVHAMKTGGTHVIANQGGCTCWCDDCGESHNCESWPTNRTHAWLKKHGESCPVARQKKIRAAVDTLKSAGVPTKLVKPIADYGKNLTKA